MHKHINMSKYNKDELERLILKEKVSYIKIGKMYGVSGNAIKKAALRIGINLPARRAINNCETFNKGNQYIKRDIGICINCGEEFVKYASQSNQYCSIKCWHAYKNKELIIGWKNDSNTSINNRIIRKYLLKKCNNKCQVCGWGIKNEFTKKYPLQMHHIDGDYINMKEENLIILCPNCHSLTDNFGSRNKNSTHYRYPTKIHKTD